MLDSSVEATRIAVAERSVLGAVLINPNCMNAVAGILGASGEKIFSDQSHASIYAALVDHWVRNAPIDMVTLLPSLQAVPAPPGSGSWATTLADIIKSVPTSANAEVYARMVLEQSRLRSIANACFRIQTMSKDTNSKSIDIIAEWDKTISELNIGSETSRPMAVDEFLPEVVTRLKAIAYPTPGTPSVIRSGIEVLDSKIHNYRGLIVIAARPKVGKTALALNIPYNAAFKQGIPSLIFSMEMDRDELGQRLLQMDCGFDIYRIRNGFQVDAEIRKVESGAENLSGIPVFVDDGSNQSITSIVATARRFIELNGHGIIMIDYLQLMRTAGKSEKRYQEISNAVRDLKNLSKELGAPIFLLSQLNKTADHCSNGIEMFDQCYESDSIKMHADLGIVIHQLKPSDWTDLHKAHGASEDFNEFVRERQGLVYVTVAANRHGVTGTGLCLFDKPMQRFKNIGSDLKESVSFARVRTVANVTQQDIEDHYEEDDDNVF